MRRAAWFVTWLSITLAACQRREEPDRGSGGAAGVEKSALAYARTGAAAELDRALELSLQKPQQSVAGQTFAAILSRCDAFYGDTRRQELVERALLRHAQPSLIEPLAKLLEPSFASARAASSSADLKRRECELFRQSLAIEILGVIAAPRGVEPLLEVLLDPSKEELQALAALALLRSGVPAESRALKLLATPDKQLPALVSLLGQMRTPRACQALLAALASAKTLELRAELAVEVVRCGSPASLEAYQKAYASIPRTTRIGVGVPAHEALAEAAVGAFDASLVPWLLEQSRASPAAAGGQGYQQSSELLAAVRLMTPEQLRKVTEVVRRRRVRQEQEAFEYCAAQLLACERRLSCYVVALSEASNQSGTEQIRGIKAAVMLGVFGNESARDALLLRYPRIRSPVIRFWAAQAIGHLTRKPAEKSLQTLAELVRAANDAGAPHDLALEQMLWRLRLRQGAPR
ncbi:MAG TPA: hypothetical protein VK524_34090 [Polyangiaceae bacterium]|nr:hypothetical protein [Polyangiaceae bacterium]